MAIHDHIAAWLEQGRSERASVGAEPGEVGLEARRLLEAISTGPVPPSSMPVGAREVEILHALVSLLTNPSSRVAFPTLDRAFELLEALPSPNWSVHRDHLESELALFAWREARARNEAASSGAWRRRVARLLMLVGDGVATSELGVLTERAERLLALRASSRRTRVPEAQLKAPELLAAVIPLLTARLESVPKEALHESEFFYGFLGNLPTPIGLFDEHEYFLSEFALLAATACRVLFRRDDAHRWLSLAEASCIGIAGAELQACRFAFQKLALRTEERAFEEVLELASKWSRTATNLGHPEEEIKLLFLNAAALREIGRLQEAATVFEEIALTSRRISKPTFEALAETNLVECLRAKGDVACAVEHAERASALLAAGADGSHLTKHRWLLGGILREQCKLSDALATYRTLRSEFVAPSTGAAPAIASKRRT